MALRTLSTAAAMVSVVGVVGAIGGGAAAWAGPLERGLVPADPAVLVHVDLEAVRDSALGRHVLSNKAAFNLQGLEGLKLFGVDVARDLLSATVVLGRKRPEQGVVIVKATPAVDGLWAHLKTEPHAKALTVDGYEILSWEDGGEKKYGVVRSTGGAGAAAGAGEAGTRTVYVADAWEVIVEALRAADGKAPNLQAEAAGGAGGAGAGGAGAGGAGAGAIIVDIRQVPEDMRRDTPGRALFGQMSSATLDIGEREGRTTVRAVMRYTDDETARLTRAVGEGALALAQMVSKSEPGLSQVEAAVAGMKVEAEGATVTISGNWAGEQVIGLVKMLMAMDEQEPDAEKK